MSSPPPRARAACWRPVAGLCVALAACGATAAGLGSASNGPPGGDRGTGRAVGKPRPPNSTPAGTRTEVADPKEAKSYPAPASAHHAAAAAPAKAGEALVAAGAPSDAEVQARARSKPRRPRSRRQTGPSTPALTPVPGGQSIGGDGTIPIPTGVPEVVQKVIAGANEIADFPYVFGGGHGSFVDNAYDCSGSVSYALAAGGLLSSPETSGELEHWGAPGPGATSPCTPTPATPTCTSTASSTTRPGAAACTPPAGWSAATDNTGYVVRHCPGCRPGRRWARRCRDDRRRVTLALGRRIGRLREPRASRSLGRLDRLRVRAAGRACGTSSSAPRPAAARRKGPAGLSGRLGGGGSISRRAWSS